MRPKPPELDNRQTYHNRDGILVDREQPLGFRLAIQWASLLSSPMRD
jgi:hypothetical protein